MRQAHLRDAVALVNYFVWLEDALLVRKAVVSEAEGAAKLLSFREQVLRKQPSCSLVMRWLHPAPSRHP